MNLDRAIQLKLLTKLAEAYPSACIADNLSHYASANDNNRFIANMAYLDEHGLVRANLRVDPGGNQLILNPRITAKGMDFLADDGGLSAILGVVTIRLHEDTLKELIAQRIAESDLAQPDKTRLLDQLRSLPGETIKHLTLKLVDAGLTNWPLALQAIETFAHIHGS